MKRMVVCFLCLALIAMASAAAFAHCEIPCGIYDDQARAAMIAEHIGTVEKSMAEIERLSAETPANYNQIVRWVTNKDEHAEKIQDLVWQYFMAQRIKPVPATDAVAYNKYVTELTLLHQLSVNAMKAKQSLDHAVIAEMRNVLEQFKASYFQA